MPKVLLTHPTLLPIQQLHRFYAGLVEGAMASTEPLTADQTMALALFADCSMRPVENPIYPDEMSLQNVYPILITRPDPDGPLEVLERHRVDLDAVRDALSIKLINGSIH